MFYAADLPIADHHLGLASQDRRDQARDLTARVLVITIGIHDDIGAQP